MVVRINFIVKTDQVQNLERTSYTSQDKAGLEMVKLTTDYTEELRTEDPDVIVNPNVRLLRKL